MGKILGIAWGLADSKALQGYCREFKKSKLFSLSCEPASIFLVKSLKPGT